MDNTESITKRDIKFLIGSFIAITAGTVFGLYIYNDVLKMHWSRRNKPYYGQMINKSQHMTPSIEYIEKEDYPKLKINITTSEYDDINKIWIPTLGHIFYANTEDEILSLVNAHRQTDSFFDASFSGIFKWKEGIIYLKNKVSDLTVIK